MHLSRLAALPVLALALCSASSFAQTTRLPVVQHRVQAGDTLEQLARRYLGDSTQWQALQQHNGGIDPYRLPPGQLLEIPLNLLHAATASVDYLQGSASLRRESQIRARYPHLLVKPLRGNLQTRLRKLDEGQYDAIILAASGLKRMGLAERIRMELSTADSLPAVGQGALGIEIAAQRYDLLEALNPLNHAVTNACVSAERALARALDGSCQVPLAAYCTEEAGLLTLRGLVGHPDGSILLQAEAQAPLAYADALGRAVAKKLADDGAVELIQSILAEQ